MSFDIVLMAIVVAGIGLSAAYVRAEYIRWRELGAAERRRESVLRTLHAERLSEQQSAARMPSVLSLQGFGDDEAANPDSSIGTGRPGGARHNPAHSDPFTERRKRERKRAAQ